LRVDAAHELDLVVLFCDVSLVDADSIGPKNPGAILVPKPPERREEADGYVKLLAFAMQHARVIGVSPAGRDGLIRRLLAEPDGMEGDLDGFVARSRL
jgi:hypothetical protein